MIPAWLIHITTVLVLFVGFGMGYWYRGWKERVDAQEDLDRDQGRHH